MGRLQPVILVFAVCAIAVSASTQSETEPILDKILARASSHKDCSHHHQKHRVSHTKPRGRHPIQFEEPGKRILVSLPHHTESSTAHKENNPSPLELELQIKSSQWVIRKSDGTETVADMKEVQGLFTEAAKNDIPKTFREFISAGTESYAGAWRYKALKALIQGTPREIVTKEEVSKEPYNAVGLIRTKNRDGEEFSCTGTFIGPRHVLTAAHCLYYDSVKDPQKRWGEVMSFQLQQVCKQDGTIASNGIKFEWDMSIVPKGYTDLAESNIFLQWEYDYALLIVKDNGIKPPTINFGWDEASDLELMKTRWPVQMAGYPFEEGDKEDCMWKINDCTLTLPAPSVYSSQHYLELRHCNPTGGASGSSLYSADANGIPTIHCIFTHAHVKNSLIPQNPYCVRITKLLFATFVHWIKRY